MIFKVSLAFALLAYLSAVSAVCTGFWLLYLLVALFGAAAVRNFIFAVGRVRRELL